MDATATNEAGRLLGAENPRRDVAGTAFLVGMLVAGGLTVAATLAVVDSPAQTGSSQVAVSTR
jgi:hypothetical protein